MKKGKSICSVLLISFLFIGLNVVFSDYSEAADEIRIGVIGPMTGPAADVGQGIKKASIMAADEINAKGGILGKKVALFFGDDESKPSAGASVVERMIAKDKIDLLTGGLHTDVALATMEIPARYRIPYVMTGPASGSITKRMIADPKKFALTFKTDPATEAIVASWPLFNTDMNSKGFFNLKTKKVAVIGENTDYGRTGAQTFRDESKKAGFEVVAYEIVDIKQADFMPILSKIKSLNPEIVWTIQTSVAAGVALLKQFLEIGIPAVYEPYYVSANPEYVKFAGSNKDGILTAGMRHQVRSGPKGDAFRKAFVQRWGMNPEMVPCWQYDVMYMAKIAYEKAGSTDPEKFSQAYAQTDYTGVAMRYVYDKNHEAIYGVGYFFLPFCQYWGDDEILVYPFDMAEGKFRTPPWMK